MENLGYYYCTILSCLSVKNSVTIVVSFIDVSFCVFPIVHSLTESGVTENLIRVNVKDPSKSTAAGVKQRESSHEYD